MSKELRQASQISIVKGSKSFALASFFFDEKTKWAAWHLYSWCRFCDDQIDEAANQQQALQRLQELREKTAQAFQTRSGHEGVFEALSVIAHEYRIPEKYAFDLLRGMEMDVLGFKYQSTEDLLDYCYCVAGAVGLMMCHVMKLTNPLALKNAVHMGLAMQMTNISRDVEDDLNLGRIYFPRQWLEAKGISEQSFVDADREAWADLAKDLVLLAQNHYSLGYQGLVALPWRAAWAVIIAAEVYSRIGHKVVLQGAHAWDQRCYVTGLEKLAIAVLASVKLLILQIKRVAAGPAPVRTLPAPLPTLEFRAEDYQFELKQKFDLNEVNI